MIRSIRARVASFGEPNRGLFLPVLGFPVKVHPSFWLTAVLAGFQGRVHLGALIQWIAVLFVSILAHELGHALMASRWTVIHRITIHGLGGEATWRPQVTVGWLQRLMIAVAGPIAGFALALVGFLLGFSAHAHWMVALTESLLWVNLAWGIFNLLPILPLDGGHAIQQVFGRFFASRAEVYVAVVGVVASVAALVAAIGLDLRWAAALVCFYGFQNGQVLKLHYDLNRKTAWQSTSPHDQTRNRY